MGRTTRLATFRSSLSLSLLAVMAAACVSHSSTTATAPTTGTTPSTIDPGGAGHSPIEPADFPPQVKVPPGYRVVEYQWSGTPGTPFRKLSASWTGPGDAKTLFTSETSLLLRAGWSVDGIVGAARSVPVPTDGTTLFRLAGFGWVGLGDLGGAGPPPNTDNLISIALHQPGIDTPIP